MSAADPAHAHGYRLRRDVDLRNANTLGIAARAGLVAEVDDVAALPRLLADPGLRGRALLVLGGGSNVLFAADPEAVVLAVRADGIAIVADDGERVRVRVEAGRGWDDCVHWSLDQGLCGLENLALIPGTTGAAPIQNIGAYGVELDQRVHAVEAFDRDAGGFVRLAARDCGFAYRDSRFKHEPDRWIVTAVEFDLSRTPALRLEYAGLGTELDAMETRAPSPADVAAAVSRIRRRKLPDPAVIGNAGSFFKNPIVAVADAERLCAADPALPVFAGHDAASRKLSAAWLIDACGWKGHRDGDAGVSAGHALVLVNHGEASGAQLLALARRIAQSVHARFGVALEPEPRLVGARW